MQTQIVTQPSSNISRRHYLDWLRVLAFAGVFFYHSARFFNSSDWHIKNAETSVVVEIIISIFNLWGMQLLFVICGASIFFALRPGGAVRFLRDRVMRLLVPLALGILVLAPPQVYLERLTHGDFQGTFFQFLPRFFDGDFAWTGVHLWFLEYLFLFTLVLLPLFVWFKRPTGMRAIGWLSRFSVRPGAMFLWVLPFALLLIVVDPFGLMKPAPAEAILRLVVYPLFVVCGFLIIADDGIQQAIIRQRRAALILALVSSATMPVIAVGLEEWGWGLDLLSFAMVMIAASLLSWSYILAILGYGMRYLNANRPLLTYANEAVLPFYILHQPVILLIGYFVIPLALPIAAKYLIIAPLAFGIVLGIYEYGIRRWNLVRQVFGMKTLAQPKKYPRISRIAAN
ncbi:MAG: acyltransferase family protein [Chloroflexi bacterium]|nr:acyltransferase family protein [Chloroflexota bacterium]